MENENEAERSSPCVTTVPVDVDEQTSNDNRIMRSVGKTAISDDRFISRTASEPFESRLPAPIRRRFRPARPFCGLELFNFRLDRFRAKCRFSATIAAFQNQVARYWKYFNRITRDYSMNHFNLLKNLFHIYRKR